MRQITIHPTLEAWREAARPLLSRQIRPSEIIWSDGECGPSLFEEKTDYLPAKITSALNIPKAFFQLAKTASCHSAPERWSLLYAAAYRLTVGGEKNLLSISSDSLTRRLQQLDKSVRRDRHKMTAFVRFRKTGEHPETGREQFVAWFEPEHHIVELTAPFFVNRFSSFDWSILTPQRCAHWDGQKLDFTDGVKKSHTPTEDALEDYWRTYYANIFNPARLKLKAMQSEMPKKYWKNLPEAPLIAELTQNAASRTNNMVEKGVNQSRKHVSRKIPLGARHPDTNRIGMHPTEALEKVADLSLEQLRSAAECCKHCPLYENATQTVFGYGKPDAKIVIVGEQPGDKEDIQGRPFVGPAGRLLRDCLTEVGFDLDDIYFTNTVKHFKWKPARGQKRRLHDKANPSEVQACKPWVIAEIIKVQPDVLITLGTTAVKALIDPDFKLLQQRGLQRNLPPAPQQLASKIIATVHPSYLLRLPDREKRELELDLFKKDLGLAADQLS